MSDTATPARPLRVLVVEDDPSIVQSLEFLLRAEGYDTRTAMRGDEALETVAHFKPDLLVLDVMLPAIDGFEVCLRLRSDPATRPIRVLMLTARGRDSEIARGRAAGADDYLTKPFATRELVERVRALMDARARPASPQSTSSLS
ncbi:MAG: response regulator transcription factor [Burkholderiales bacterium]